MGMIMTMTVNYHHKLTHPNPLFCSLASVHRINVREVVCGPNLVVEIYIFIVNNVNILIPFNINLVVGIIIVLFINNNDNNIFILFSNTRGRIIIINNRSIANGFDTKIKKYQY